MRRLLNAVLTRIEAWIEDVCDPDRTTLLQGALCRLNARLLSVLDENEALHQRLLESEHEIARLSDMLEQRDPSPDRHGRESHG